MEVYYCSVDKAFEKVHEQEVEAFESKISSRFGLFEVH